RDLHQNEADGDLYFVRRRIDRRIYLQQAVPGHRVRRRVPSDRGGLAQIDAALGAVLPRAGGGQRARLAHADDRYLGELQILRRGAADIRVRGVPVSAVAALCGGTGGRVTPTAP